MQQERDQFGYPIRRDPPPPPLASPDPVTIHDLSPGDRARAIIIPTSKSGYASRWYFPNG